MPAPTHGGVDANSRNFKQESGGSTKPSPDGDPEVLAAKAASAAVYIRQLRTDLPSADHEAVFGLMKAYKCAQAHDPLLHHFALVYTCLQHLSRSGLKRRLQLAAA